MNLADIVLILILLFGIGVGWNSGIIRVLAGIGAIVLGYILARNFSALIAAELTKSVPGLNPAESGNGLAKLLSLIIDTNAIANHFIQIIVFIVLFVVVRWVVRKLANLLSSFFRGGLLGLLNKALGAFVCFFLFAILINVAVDIVLPILSGIEFVAATITFFHSSKVVLPLIYALPLILIHNV